MMEVYIGRTVIEGTREEHMLAVQRIGRMGRTSGSKERSVTYQRQRVLDVLLSEDVKYLVPLVQPSS
jgi:hypothetical protein